MEMDGSEFFQHDPLKSVVVKETYNGNTFMGLKPSNMGGFGEKRICLGWRFMFGLVL